MHGHALSRRLYLGKRVQTRLDERAYGDMGAENLHYQKNHGKYPQESYTEVVRVIQPEWIFLQCVTWDTGDAFAGVDKMIRETFLPHILFRKTKSLSPILGALSTIPAKKPGLGLLNTVPSEKYKYLSSQIAITELIQYVVEEEHNPMPTTFRRSSKKGVTVRKTGMMQMMPHSRVYLEVSLVPDGA